jgi:Fe-S cluster biogenesis protein NfuA/nitrite reductase/ring-hydroxylating ferredoxin subunit
MASKESELQQRMRQIDELVQEVQSGADPAVRDRAIKLVELLLEIHGAGLDRILELISQSDLSGDALIDSFPDDPLVGSLLLLHGLHPLELEPRVRQALDKVRPYLQSHKGNVELLGIDDGVIRLRLEGSCHSCPSSSLTLKLAIEEALAEFAPDAAGLVVEGVVAAKPPPSMVPLRQSYSAQGSTQTKGHSENGHHGNGRNGNGGGSGASHDHDPTAAVQRNGWEEIDGLDALVDGELRTFPVMGVSIMCCRVGRDLYAYRNLCPACGQPLDGSAINAAAVTCAHCGQRYDAVRAGRSMDNTSLTLEPFPLLVDAGRAKIAVPALS